MDLPPVQARGAQGLERRGAAAGGRPGRSERGADEGGALSFTRVDENRTKLSDELVRAVEEAAGGKDTDLIPDVYEGGLKVWECTHDLLQVLHDMAACGELPQREGYGSREVNCGKKAARETEPTLEAAGAAGAATARAGQARFA